MSLCPFLSVAYHHKRFLRLVLLPDSPAFFVLEPTDFREAHQWSWYLDHLTPQLNRQHN
ncbi:hypothetical protein Sjap_023738 [Stephania japonica]|uniref:Uncharacterized protein n=1 Tax=Stephania japonica TaxID=461633 RepID=A0AAP0EC58_9MAGN